jgi:hypothetical protein
VSCIELHLPLLLCTQLHAAHVPIYELMNPPEAGLAFPVNSPTV